MKNSKDFLESKFQKESKEARGIGNRKDRMIGGLIKGA